MEDDRWTDTDNAIFLAIIVVLSAVVYIAAILQGP